VKSSKLQEKLHLHFPFKPTKEQLIADFSGYITTLGSKSNFLLKGYAETGKTILVSSLGEIFTYLRKALCSDGTNREGKKIF